VSPGWICLHRSLAEHQLWLVGRFTPGQAWVDLLMRANYQDGRVLRGGRWIPVARGQVFTSQKALAARWRWDRKTVRSFLDALKVDAMLAIETSKETDTGYTLLTILNFERFQGETTNGLDIRTGIEGGTRPDIESASNGHPIPTSNKKNKGTRKAHTLDDEEFDRFYQRYPRRVAPADARKAWVRATTQATAADILAGLERQLPARGAMEKRFRPYPATWLNGGRWADEDPVTPPRTAPERNADPPHGQTSEPWFGPAPIR
jgi:hypothetical protein